MEIKETKSFGFAFKVHRISKDGKAQEANYNFESAAATQEEALKIMISDLKNVIAQAEEELRKMQ